MGELAAVDVHAATGRSSKSYGGDRPAERLPVRAVADTSIAAPRPKAIWEVAAADTRGSQVEEDREEDEEVHEEKVRVSVSTFGDVLVIFRPTLWICFIPRNVVEIS